LSQREREIAAKEATKPLSAGSGVEDERRASGGDSEKMAPRRRLKRPQKAKKIARANSLAVSLRVRSARSALERAIHLLFRRRRSEEGRRGEGVRGGVRPAWRLRAHREFEEKSSGQRRAGKSHLGLPQPCCCSRQAFPLPSRPAELHMGRDWRGGHARGGPEEERAIFM